MRKKSIFFLSVCVLLSCAIKKNLQQAILNEATTIHQDAQKLGSQATVLLADLLQQRNSIQVQGRQLTQTEMDFTEKVDDLRGQFQTWEYEEPKLPISADVVRLKDKERLIKKQEEWKGRVFDLLGKMKGL